MSFLRLTIAGVQEAVRTPGSLPWKRPQATPSLLVPCCREPGQFRGEDAGGQCPREDGAPGCPEDGSPACVLVLWFNPHVPEGSLSWAEGMLGTQGVASLPHGNPRGAAHMADGATAGKSEGV